VLNLGEENPYRVILGSLKRSLLDKKGESQADLEAEAQEKQDCTLLKEAIKSQK
jgi:hypothetical protein